MIEEPSETFLELGKNRFLLMPTKVKVGELHCAGGTHCSAYLLQKVGVSEVEDIEPHDKVYGRKYGFLSS